ncbi:MAG: putative metal-binding motif-containing protein [Myxococcota bacterium]|nr:putative metal-binding motif-containing protein [Myxococcota bacterium]
MVGHRWLIFGMMVMGCGDSSVDPSKRSPAVPSTDSDTGGAARDSAAPDAVGVDADGDGHPEESDCNDDDPTTHPGALEECDGVDNNCDGAVDEGLLRAFYPDVDADGYGSDADMVEACERPDGWIGRGGDCNDGDPGVSPDAAEVCDGQDTDCDGTVDGPDPLDPTVFYADSDGDGFGGETVTLAACSMPDGYTLDARDCDDTNPFVSPLGFEVCDGVDNNCDGTVDEDSEYDGLDWFRDSDGDGFGDATVVHVGCTAPAGYVGNPDDCDDGQVMVHPDADEFCNGADDDCDEAVDEGFPLTVYYRDADGDGHGSVVEPIYSCMPLTGFAAVGDDCDDDEYWSHPGLVELCDSIDNDCNGLVDDEVVFTDFVPDADGDGYGDASGPITRACSPPPGMVVDDTDCDDSNAAVYPGVTETCNGLDDDCDGSIDELMPEYTFFEDVDGDGYGVAESTTVACEPPPGFAELPEDCNDADDGVHPGAYEFCDGEDDDCDGIIDDDCGFSRNYVLFVTDTFIGSASSTWLNSRDEADEKCAAYAASAGIAGSDFRIVYSTPDEDARDFLDYEPGLDVLFNRSGVEIADADLYDGSSPVLPDMKSWTIQGSGSDGRFSECSGSYPSGSWPICQFCSEKFTCGSSTDALFAPSACCWTGNRAVVCMGEMD